MNLTLKLTRQRHSDLISRALWVLVVKFLTNTAQPGGLAAPRMRGRR
jgi:hypothetical protein